MAEFTSKKLYPSVTEAIPSSVASSSQPIGESLGYDVIYKGMQCLVKGQELYQDFVTFGRSSQTKMIWIGTALVLFTCIAFWILIKKIGLLK